MTSTDVPRMPRSQATRRSNPGEARPLAVVLGVLAVLVAWRLSARAALGIELHYDEAQYWSWSLDPAFGYFSKPPLVAWAIAAARAVCGDGSTCIRMPSTLAFSVSSLFVYALAARLFGPRTAVASALLFALSPLAAFYSWFITTDSLLLLAWSIATWALAMAVERAPTDRRATGFWIVVGVASGFGLLAKYTMGLFAVCAAGFLLHDAQARRHLARPGPWLGVAAAALLFAPNIVWNAQHRFATLAHTAGIGGFSNPQFAPDGLLRFGFEQIGVYGPVAAIAFMAASVGFGGVRSDPYTFGGWTRARTYRLLAWLSWPFVAAIAIQAGFARALANWAAPTWVAGAVLAAAWLASRASPWWLRAAIGVDVLVAIALYHHPAILDATGLALPVNRDPLAQVRGWAPIGREVQARLESENARLVVADDRRLLAELLYYAGPSARDALTWNPSRVVDNHYRLTRDVADARGGPFVIATDGSIDEARLARSFEGLTPIGAVTSWPCRGCERTLILYRARSFSGYH